ncbi:MAG: hypothetical protein V4525_16375 [Pseudomonadota bacterium]
MSSLFSFWHIVLLVGIGLLILGGASAYALFARSLKSTPAPTTGSDTNVGTLWGLFVLGLTLGLILIYWAQSRLS